MTARGQARTRDRAADGSAWMAPAPDRDWIPLPTHVRIVEVAPRDGFQNLSTLVETKDKIWAVESLTGLGFDRVEVTSFVHPKAVPQMRDADAVAEAAPAGGAGRMALVPNARGAERALVHAFEMLNVVISASETHNRRNLNAAVDESLTELAATTRLASGQGVPVRLTVATAFGCPYEGWVDPASVLRLARAGADLGASEVCLGDTTGMANPRQVFELFRMLAPTVDGVAMAVHLHNTRGSGAANLLAALQAGVAVVDAAVGGLGGCPYAPGATGNVCTEDMVHMLEAMGIRTGVDLAGLIAVAQELQARLGVELPGQVMRAGISPTIALTSVAP